MTLVSSHLLQSRYRILRPLGQGGMGAVYLAEDLRLGGRRCAIKEGQPDPLASPSVRAQVSQQFQVEASTLATLNHPHLPRVSDYFTEAGNEYLVMDYVEGETLESVLQRQSGPLPEASVRRWAEQVLDALIYLHSQQPHPLIHRDIKPANLILTPKGTIKLVDFGLVKLLDPRSPHTMSIMRGMGTPEYTPLEQYGSGTSHTDARSDLYALGATLYHLLTNVAPAPAPQRLIDASLLPPPRHHNPALSAVTEGSILKALAVLPADRFQSAVEMRASLACQPISPAPATHVLPTAPHRKGKAAWLGSVSVGGLVVALLVFATWIVRPQVHGATSPSAVGVRVCPKISYAVNSRNSRVDGVVPFAMEGVRNEVNLGELSVRDTSAFGIETFIEATLYPETSLGLGGGNQFHNDLMSHERLAAPVLRDKGEEAMLDLVPFAGSRGQMADGDGYAQLVG